MSSQPLPPAVLVTRAQVVTRHGKEVHAEISAVIRAINEKLTVSKALPIIYPCPSDPRVFNVILQTLKEAGYIVKVSSSRPGDTDTTSLMEIG